VISASRFPFRLAHIESGGRSPEERRAAAEARARARRGEPATGDEELLEPAGPSGAEGEMERHYGGGDVYLRRRLIALGAVIVLIVVIFLLVGGC
jgi:hypothetical protein